MSEPLLASRVSDIVEGEIATDPTIPNASNIRKVPSTSTLLSDTTPKVLMTFHNIDPFRGQCQSESLTSITSSESNHCNTIGS
ncbi:hypothetical protein ACOSQ4_003313 [Xanthoceras sorbifolium]